MKRIIAGLLSLVLLLTSFTGVAVAEVKLPYEYAPVTFFLNGRDIDGQFRQWAYEKLKVFRKEYLEQSKAFDEYIRLSRYKKWYDEMIGNQENKFGEEIRKVQYTSHVITDEQKEMLYLRAMVDTLQTYRKLDPSYVSDYLESLRESNRELWRPESNAGDPVTDEELQHSFALDDSFQLWEADGTLQVNNYLKLVETKANADLNEKLINIVTEAISLSLETAIEYYNTLLKSKMGELSKKQKTLTEVEEVFWSIGKQTMENWIGLVKENVQRKAENIIRAEVVYDCTAVLFAAREADIATIKRLYLTSDNDDALKKKVAQELYDYYNSDVFKDALQSGAEAYGDELVTKAMAELNLQLDPVLDKVIGEIVGKQFIQVTVDEMIDKVCSKIDKDKDFGDNRNGISAVLKLFKALFDLRIDFSVELMKETGRTDVGMEDAQLISMLTTGKYKITDQNGKEVEKNLYESEEVKNFVNELAGVVFDEIRKGDLALEKRKEHLEDLKKSSEQIVPNSEVFLWDKIKDIVIIELIEKITPESTFNVLVDDYIGKEDTIQNKEIMQTIANEILSIISDVIPDIMEAVGTYLIMNEISKVQGIVVQGVEMVVEGAFKKLLTGLGNALKIVANIAQDAWNIGGNIVKTVYEIHDYENGEDLISYLAELVVVQADLRTQMVRRTVYNMGSLEDILDKNKMSLAEVVNRVSAMQWTMKYDMGGARAYMNVVQSSLTTKMRNSIFMYIINGNKYSVDGYAYKYTNAKGQIGLLDYVSAYNIWNEIVTMNEKLNQGFSEVEIVL